MIVELTKRQLVHMVKGVDPPTMEWVEKLSRQGLGQYSGSYGTWAWGNGLNVLSNEELWSLYTSLTK